MWKKSDLNEIPSVDANVLHALQGLADPADASAFVNDLIDTFIGAAPKMLEDLTIAVEDGNEKRVVYLAHRLKGMNANIGAKKLAEYLAVLEGDPRSSKEAKQLMTVVHKEYDLVRKELLRNWKTKGEA